MICDQHNWETNDPCVILPRQQCTTHDDVGLGETNQSLFYWLFFWCLDTKTYKKYISILTLEDSKKFDRKFGKRTINYYEFPEHENTLSESSKSPHFLLCTHEGDNFHLSNFSVGEQKILSIHYVLRVLKTSLWDPRCQTYVFKTPNCIRNPKMGSKQSVVVATDSTLF